MGWALCKVLKTFLKMDKGGNQTYEPQNKDIDDYAKILISKGCHRQILHVKKIRKRISWIQKFRNWMNIQKREDKDWLQQSEQEYQ